MQPTTNDESQLCGVDQSIDTSTMKMSQNYKFFDIHLFRKLKMLGVGAFSQVFLTQEKKTGILYAAKCLTSDFIDQKRKSSKMSRLVNEFTICSITNHRAIMKFYGLSPLNFDDDPFPVLLLEYLPNGSLGDLVQQIQNGNKPRSFNNTKLLINIYGIARGMRYLHSNNIIHGDLTPNNILLDSNYYPKIGDFGLSTPLDDLSISTSVSNMTIIYSSPERLSDCIKSTKGDVYSFAMCVFELFGNEIDLGRTPFQIMKNIINGDRPAFKNQVPDCYKKLIERCWSEDPDHRPTFDEIVNLLSTNRRFITELDDVDETEFINYVKMVNLNNVPLTSETKPQFEAEAEEEPLSINVPSFNLDNYEKRTKIGEGSFGAVYVVEEKRTHQQYSAKVSIREYYESTKKERNVVNFIREVMILNKLHHPSIMKFIGYSSKNFKNSFKPVIVTELLQNGSLENMIELERESRSHELWNDTKKLINLYGIAHGLQYMHSCCIFHRDLKPANILVDEHLYPKICDFGFSKDYLETNDDCKQSEQTQLIGTPIYIAPEIYEDYSYSEASDVYAYSLLMYELVTNTKPNLGSRYLQIAKNIIENKYRPPIPEFIPPCYKKLIEDCWQQDPKIRPSFKNIVDRLRKDHNFITENVDEEEYLDYIEMLEKGESQSKPYPTVIMTNRGNDKESEEKMIKGNIDLRQYKKSDKLGQDLYWKYYIMEDNNTGQKYIGQISNTIISNLSQNEISNFYHEIDIIKQLDHPNLVKIEGYSFDNYKGESKPIVINDFYKRQTLFNIIELKRKRFIIENWDDTTKLINLFGIASGMKYLHSKGLLHHNFEPNSIIVDDNLYPKLTNYGIFMKLQISSSLSQSASRYRDSPIYQSPEVLRLEEPTQSSEVYTFGMIAYEIIYENRPFEGLQNAKIIHEIVDLHSRPKFPIHECDEYEEEDSHEDENDNQVPICYKELIERCWSDDPSNRPTFDEIVENLKNDSRFITGATNKTKFLKYVQSIENYTHRAKNSSETKCQRKKLTETTPQGGHRLKTGSAKKDRIQERGKKVIEKSSK